MDMYFKDDMMVEDCFDELLEEEDYICDETEDGFCEDFSDNSTYEYEDYDIIKYEAWEAEVEEEKFIHRAMKIHSILTFPRTIIRAFLKVVNRTKILSDEEIAEQCHISVSDLQKYRAWDEENAGGELIDSFFRRRDAIEAVLPFLKRFR